MNKGKKVEYKVRDFFIKHGFSAERIPISGNSQSSFLKSCMEGDVIVHLAKDYIVLEVKSLKNPPKTFLPILKEKKIKLVVKSGSLLFIPQVVFESFFNHIGKFKNPPKTCQQFLNKLEKFCLTTCAILSYPSFNGLKTILNRIENKKTYLFAFKFNYLPLLFILDTSRIHELNKQQITQTKRTKKIEKNNL